MAANQQQVKIVSYKMKENWGAKETRQLGYLYGREKLVRESFSVPDITAKAKRNFDVIFVLLMITGSHPCGWIGSIGLARLVW